MQAANKCLTCHGGQLPDGVQNVYTSYPIPRYTDAPHWVSYSYQDGALYWSVQSEFGVKMVKV